MTFDHDALFRHTYEQPENASSLLRAVLPTALVASIDWGSLRLVPGSSVDETLRARHADLLFTAQVQERPLLLYVVLEHKSSADRLTVLQLLRYAVRTYDRYLQVHPEANALPPIVSIVAYHGERTWHAPRTLLELIDLGSLPTGLRDVLVPLQPNLRILLDDLAAVPEAELRERSGTLMHRLTSLLLQFVRPASERDPAEFVQRWQDLLRALWNAPRGRTGMIALFSYLTSQLEAPPERLGAAAALIHDDARTMGKTIADQLRDEGLQKGLHLGRAEGKAEGRAEGRAELLLRQMRARFGMVPNDAEQRVRAADPDQLDRWAERILTAAGLDDFFA